MKKIFRNVFYSIVDVYSRVENWIITGSLLIVVGLEIWAICIVCMSAN